MNCYCIYPSILMYPICSIFSLVAHVFIVFFFFSLFEHMMGLYTCIFKFPLSEFIFNKHARTHTNHTYIYMLRLRLYYKSTIGITFWRFIPIN
jgi:hypothetical protein